MFYDGSATGATARNLERRVEHINRTRDAYRARVGMGAEEREVLEAERGRLAVELASLEQEAEQFRSQIELLEREIESIARNEALIEIAEKRRAAEERRIDRRATTALNRLYDEISERRTEQAERLQGLQQQEGAMEYETRAKLLLEGSQYSQELEPIETADEEAGVF